MRLRQTGLLAAALMAVTLLVPAGAVAAGPSAHRHRVSMLGLSAKVPAGWRRCGYNLQHTTKCRTDSWEADAWGLIHIDPWSAGETRNCLQTQFTDAGHGPRIAVPAKVRKIWHKRGWRTPIANRSPIPTGDPGASPTGTLILMCARTRDGRVITMAFYRSPGQSARTATKALWTAARTVRITSKKVYLPGAARHVRPHRAFWSGDGTTYLAKLRWSKWSGRAAWGAGVYKVNDCDPYCAVGHYTSYRVRLRAHRPFYLRCAMFFRRVEVSFPGKRPPRTHQHFTFRVDRSYDSQELYTFGSCPY